MDLAYHGDGILQQVLLEDADGQIVPRNAMVMGPPSLSLLRGDSTPVENERYFALIAG